MTQVPTELLRFFLSTISLYTLNACPMKSLFKRRNCLAIDDRNTTDWTVKINSYSRKNTNMKSRVNIALAASLKCIFISWSQAFLSKRKATWLLFSLLLRLLDCSCLLDTILLLTWNMSLVVKKRKAREEEMFLTLIWYENFEEMKVKQGEFIDSITVVSIKTGHRVPKKCIDGNTNDWHCDF